MTCFTVWKLASLHLLTIFTLMVFYKHYKTIRFYSNEYPFAIKELEQGELGTHAITKISKTIIYMNPSGNFLTRMTKRDMLIPQDAPRTFPVWYSTMSRNFDPDQLFMSRCVLYWYVYVYLFI
jgi:hypothetical protein